MKKWIAFIAFNTILLSGFAQQLLYYTGYGRVELNRDLLDEKSDLLKNDSTSTRRGLNGRFLFDLGINLQPSEIVRVSTILRATNEFGGFFSQGSALQFRQIKVQGILAKRFNYQIGDLDLKLTPFTLNNFEEIDHDFEASIYSMRRQITSYENFNIENNWRLQGLQTNTALKFNKGVEKIDLNVFGTRVKKTNFANIPDRLFLGGQIGLKQSDFLSIGGQIVSLTDLVGSTDDTVSTSNNTVATTNYKLSKSFSDSSLVLEFKGEFGLSNFDKVNVDKKSNSNAKDGFADFNLEAKLPKIKTAFLIGYRNVGVKFYSPGSQTRRIFDNQQSVKFVGGQNGKVLRNANLFDRITDLSLYNGTLSSLLMAYNPAYNNVTPYGKATPNRKGLEAGIKSGDKDSLYLININGSFLQETIGEGVKETRSFMKLYAGGKLRINKLINIKKGISVNGSYRLENTSRETGAIVDLKSNLIDLGLEVETLKNLLIEIGYKGINATGNEYFGTRDENNEYTKFDILQYDFQETVLGLGMQYKVSDHSSIALSGIINDYKEKNKVKFPLSDYSISQVYFNYILKF